MSKKKKTYILKASQLSFYTSKEVQATSREEAWEIADTRSLKERDFWTMDTNSGDWENESCEEVTK